MTDTTTKSYAIKLRKAGEKHFKFVGAEGSMRFARDALRYATQDAAKEGPP